VNLVLALILLVAVLLRLIFKCVRPTILLPLLRLKGRRLYRNPLTEVNF
jgi:hypothetical protein